MQNTLHHAEIIDRITDLLEKRYIFLEGAQQMNADLRAKLPAYCSIDDPQVLAQTLTDDLQSSSHDKHLRLGYDPTTAASLLSENMDEGAQDAEWLKILATENYGFQRLEWLPGQIGYLDLRSFAPPASAGDTAIAAMSFLANAKAIIFDLRKNGGGSPNMVQLLTSYLFDAEIRHLNSFYIRHSDTYTHFWTLPYVPGKRLPNVDVYVLTSNRTFSGAEEFTYNLKTMERATIIGETTGGGAHPGDLHAVGELFTIFVPDGRAINPITQTNWEGTGVTPHIQVPAEDALRVAQITALEKLVERAETEAERQVLRQTLATLQASAS